ncbi:MAG: sugar-binding protein [Treponema sp.]|nr:sugar-binding protein [Treponema sp.]MCL2271835.1 sugar-binding protein [Treponema sp.]
MKKLAAVSILILFAAGALFAGGSAEGNRSFVGVAMPETHVQRWIKDGAYLVGEVTKRGYEAEAQWSDGVSQATQNSHIEGFLTKGAKALLIGQINQGVAAAVNRARQEGVVVVAYDRIIQGTNNYDYLVTFNNYKVGTFQGQAIASALDLNNATTAAPKTITLFAGSPTDANANFFFQGAMDVLLPFIDKGVLRVVGPFPRHYSESTFQRIATEGWSASIAKARMEGLLIGDARTVTLDAVLTPNDTLAIAIIEACKADAKYRTKLPVVTGQDAQFSSMVSIKNGEQNMTVFKDAKLQAAAAALLVDQLLKKQRVNIPGSVLITPDSTNALLKEIGNTGTGYVNVILLDPILITKDSNFQYPSDVGWLSPAEAAQLK